MNGKNRRTAQKRERERIPVVGAPFSFTSLHEARRDERREKGVLVNNVLYWGMTLKEVLLMLRKRDDGYYGPTVGRWVMRESSEERSAYGYGVKMMQLEQTEEY